MPVVEALPAAAAVETSQSAAIARASVRGLVLRQALANLGGVATVALFLWFVFPTQDSGAKRDTQLNLIVFASYLGGILLVGLPANWLIMQGLARWIRGKRPGRILQALTLRIPAFQAGLAMAGWMGAAIVFSSVNRSPRVGVGILLAGVLVSATLFLIVERHLRPVFELTLDGKVHGRRSNNLLPRLMMFWALGSGLPLLVLGLTPLLSKANANGVGSSASWRTSLVILVALIGGGFIMRYAALSVTRPVESIRRAMADVGGGDLGVRVPVDDLGETGRLAEGFNTMVDGLTERQRVQEQFGRQVGRAVAEWALQNPELSVEGHPQGVETSLSVLFVDINGFTAFSETHTPTEAVEMLNIFFQMVDDAASAHGGWINKFEGDAALIIFGAPTPMVDHAIAALETAADICAACADSNRWSGVGIGVASGVALAGLVGSTNRYEYTVIGDVVNVASRVSDLAKQLGESALATADAIATAKDQLREQRPRLDGPTEPDRSGPATQVDERCQTAPQRWRSLGSFPIRGRVRELELFAMAPESVE